MNEKTLVKKEFDFETYNKHVVMTKSGINIKNLLPKDKNKLASSVMYFVGESLYTNEFTWDLNGKSLDNSDDDLIMFVWE